MNKKLILFFLIWILFVLAFSIEMIKADGRNLARSAKDIEVGYHDNNNDIMLFGTDKWAVKFDFDQWYDDIDTLSFLINGAAVYVDANAIVPNVSVQLLDDNDGLPGALISSSTQNFNPGWNDINFNGSFSKHLVWLIVNMPTGANKPYMVASNSTGKHSYFYQNSAYYNFNAYGFDADLMFSLKGNFEFDTNQYDLVLTNYSIDGIMTPESNTKANISIKNICNKEITNVYLIQNYSNPNNSVNVRDSIFIIDRINPDEEIVLDQALIPEIHFASDACQYWFEAMLYCDQSDKEPLENNENSFYLNVFPFLNDKILIENFMQSYNTSAINLWNEQTALINNDRIIRLDYFPESSDLFNEHLALFRNQYYDNFSYPNTIIHGTNKIYAYPSDYSTKFNTSVDQMLNTYTFLDVQEVAITDSVNSLKISFKIKNPGTRIYSTELSDMKIFVYLAQPYSYNDFHGLLATNSFNNLQSGTTLTCNLGEEQSVLLYYPKDQISLIDDILLKDTYLFVLIQNNNNQEIYYTNLFEMPDIQIQNGLINVTPEQINMSVYPNPCQTNSQLNLKFTNENQKKLSIYNIKGQKIKQFTSNLKDINWDLKDFSNKTVASGVYFIKVQDISNGKETLKKVMVLK